MNTFRTFNGIILKNDHKSWKQLHKALGVIIHLTDCFHCSSSIIDNNSIMKRVLRRGRNRKCIRG